MLYLLRIYILSLGNIYILSLQVSPRLTINERVDIIPQIITLKVVLNLASNPNKVPVRTVNSIDSTPILVALDSND